MRNAQIVPSWQNALIILSGTVVSLIIVLVLHWGRPLLIPIALAALLMLLLDPLVKRLQRRGTGRVSSVLLVVFTVGLTLSLIGGLLLRQVSVLVTELPENTANIKARVQSLRQLASGPLSREFEKMAEEISVDATLPSAEQTPDQHTNQGTISDKQVAIPEPIFVRTESTLWLTLTGYLNSLFEVLATLGFCLILLVIFLIGRDDLRDRVVVLAGKAHIAVTSKALEDVTDRISRYLLMVGMLNGGFGIALTLGLLALQVPYALLWGFLAATMRFIPYIGPWIGAIGPIAIALATSAGWFQPLAVFGLVLILELSSNNVIEPLVFGHSTGVSSTALIISAAFWLYLWGPIGLVLSAPIAVCLMVLGKNIPQLAFLNLLLGNEPALNADMGIYQRFMLGDELEANRIVLQKLKVMSTVNVFDEMLIPTLTFANRDRHKGQLTAEDHQLVLSGVQGTLAETQTLLQSLALLKKSELQQTMSEEHIAPSVISQPARILLCPATDETDTVALEMLRQLLDSELWEIEVVAIETLTSELAAQILSAPPAIICIAALPPRGMAHARYLCKRLRAAAPQLQIVVGRWGQTGNQKLEREKLEQSGASFVTTSLAETCQLLKSRLALQTPKP